MTTLQENTVQTEYRFPSLLLPAEIVLPPTNEPRWKTKAKFAFLIHAAFATLSGGHCDECGGNIYSSRGGYFIQVATPTEDGEGWSLKSVGRMGCNKTCARKQAWKELGFIDEDPTNPSEDQT